MKKVFILVVGFLFSMVAVKAQNGSGNINPQNVTQEVKKEVDKIKSSGDVVKKSKKKSKTLTQAQKDALNKKKKKVNAKNAKKELDKVLK